MKYVIGVLLILGGLAWAWVAALAAMMSSRGDASLWPALPGIGLIGIGIAAMVWW